MGCFVGKIALENGKGTMTDFKYVDGASVLPGRCRGEEAAPGDGLMRYDRSLPLPLAGEGARAARSRRAG